MKKLAILTFIIITSAIMVIKPLVITNSNISVAGNPNQAQSGNNHPYLTCIMSYNGGTLHVDVTTCFPSSGGGAGGLTPCPSNPEVYC